MVAQTAINQSMTHGQVPPWCFEMPEHSRICHIRSAPSLRILLPHYHSKRGSKPIQLVRCVLLLCGLASSEQQAGTTSNPLAVFEGARKLMNVPAWIFYWGSLCPINTHHRHRRVNTRCRFTGFQTNCQEGNFCTCSVFRGPLTVYRKLANKQNGNIG